MRSSMPEEDCRHQICGRGLARRVVDEPSVFSLRAKGGVSIVGNRWGEGSGPMVVFLHGGGQTRHSWSKAAESLVAAGYSAVTYDARGHGDSGWSANGDYCIDTMIDDLALIVGMLSGPLVIVGASMGGITGMIAAGEGRVSALDGLVLVDIAPRVEAAGVARIMGFMGANPGGFESLEQARDAIAAYNPHRPPSSDLAGLKKNLRQGADGRYRWHWDPDFLAQATARHNEGRLIDLERRLAAAEAIRVPTLLVRGAASDIVSTEAARELCALIPGARVVDIASAGHMVVGDRNDVFLSAITPFLQQLYGDKVSRAKYVT